MFLINYQSMCNGYGIMPNHFSQRCNRDNEICNFNYSNVVSEMIKRMLRHSEEKKIRLLILPLNK